mmetsp:Transcript_103434/g.316600  ORF Transcript_103434/g.316600 Transcript_103434/m.316600 type:complete len:278 (-) Transcript_103434:877-1710(-)
MVGRGGGPGGEEEETEDGQSGHGGPAVAGGPDRRGGHRADRQAHPQLERRRGVRTARAGEEQGQPQIRFLGGDRLRERLLQVCSALLGAEGGGPPPGRAGAQGQGGPREEGGQRAEQRLRDGLRRASASQEGGRVQAQRADGGLGRQDQDGVQWPDRAGHQVPPGHRPVRGQVRGRPVGRCHRQHAGGELDVHRGGAKGSGRVEGDARGRDPQRHQSGDPRAPERGCQVDERPKRHRRLLGQGVGKVRSEARRQQHHQKGEAGEHQRRAAPGVGRAL